MEEAFPLRTAQPAPEGRVSETLSGLGTVRTDMDEQGYSYTLQHTHTDRHTHIQRCLSRNKTIKVATDALLQGKHCLMITGKNRM